MLAAKIAPNESDTELLHAVVDVQDVTKLPDQIFLEQPCIADCASTNVCVVGALGCADAAGPQADAAKVPGTDR